MALKTAVRHDQVTTSLFDETLARFLGVNPTDGRCLEIVSLNGRMTAGQLAEHARLTTGAVTALVDRLERSGYVRRARNRADRRKVWIEPTDLLERITGRIFSQYAEIGELVMGYFSAPELAAITAFLDMNSAITRERTRLLLQHMVPADAENADRLVEARAFERDTELMNRRARQAFADGVPVSDRTFEE